jgi:hypothetical protein
MIDMYGNYKEEKNDLSDAINLAALMTDVAVFTSKNMLKAGLIEEKDMHYVGLGASALLHDIGEEVIQYAAKDESVSKLAFITCCLYEELHPGEMASVGRKMAKKAGIDLEEEE